MRLRLSLIAIVAFAGLAALVGSDSDVAAQQPGASPRVRPMSTAGPSAFVPGQLLVKFATSLSDSEVAATMRSHGLGLLQSGSPSSYLLLSTPTGAEESVLDALRRSPRVEDAGLNMIVYALGCPLVDPAVNDPNYCYQWHYNDGDGSINAEVAWTANADGRGVTVAIIDTGLAYQEFADPVYGGAYGPIPAADDWAYAMEFETGRVVLLTGSDLVNGDSEPEDDNGHGTHVAGTVGQATNNNLRVAGVAPGVAIMPLKVLDYNGSGTLANVINAIYMAANNGADVINMSLGFGAGVGPEQLPGLGQAISEAYAAGVTIVAASGNDGGAVNYPAAYPEVIAVGAVGYDGVITGYSSRGAEQELTAPGGDNNVDRNGDGWPDGVLQETCPFAADFSSWPWTFRYLCEDWFFQGTSMASLHVAGVAALVIGADPTLNPAGVRAILQNSARDRGTPNRDSTYGYGIVDAGAAVAAASVALPDGTPNSLVATAISATQIGLSWADNSTNEAGFAIERSSGAEFAEIATVGTDVMAYSDAGLTASTPYIYRVRAFNGGGGSLYSNTAGATTLEATTAISMYVASIGAISTETKGKNVHATVDVTVVDNNGDPVEGATVTGDWLERGATVKAGSSATTDANGVATVSSGGIKGATPDAFCVSNVAHASLSYDATANASGTTCANGGGGGEAPADTVEVTALIVQVTTKGKNVKATATVQLEPVPSGSGSTAGLTVQGTWTVAGSDAGSGSAVTDSNGVAVISSGKLSASAGDTVTFCVTGVDGVAYGPAAPDCGSGDVP